MIINVDSDGVVYSLDSALDKLYPQIVRDRTRWDYGNPDAIERFFTEGVLLGVFLVGEPVPGAIDGIRALEAAGHRVRIVTSKTMGTDYLTYVARVNALEWYDRHDLSHLEIAFTGHEWGKDAYPADLVIDDQPDLKWTQSAPTVNVLFDQPWNRDPLAYVARVQERPNFDGWLQLHRAFGWGDVLELAEQMGGGILLDKAGVA